MEALTRLVADSLARHGLDRPVDPRRLQWSRWFRCDSPHSLLVIPSKPGIFALAEDVMDLASGNAHVETTAPGCPDRSSAAFAPGSGAGAVLGGAALQRCALPPLKSPALAAAAAPKRMLAVLQFFEDDDMAFTLDRMFTRVNPMRSRLVSGRCFLRFVVIEDQEQRRTICTALNQWLLASAEKASGLPADFSSSLELTESVARTLSSASAGMGTDRVGWTLQSANANTGTPLARAVPSVVKAVTPHLDSGSAKNLHCPHRLPSGF